MADVSSWRDQLQPPHRSWHFTGRSIDLHFTGPAIDVNETDRSAPTPIYDQVRRDRCPHDDVINDQPLCSPTLDWLCLSCGHTWTEPHQETHP